MSAETSSTNWLHVPKRATWMRALAVFENCDGDEVRRASQVMYA